MRTRSMWCGSPTTPSTTCAAESNSRPSGTAAADTTPCTGPASCWSPRPRAPPKPDGPGYGACSTLAPPTARSATPGAADETLPSFYDIDDAELGAATVDRLACGLQDPGLPDEINRLGRTLWTCRTQMASWHTAKVTNAAAEAANNLGVSLTVYGWDRGHLAMHRVALGRHQNGPAAGACARVGSGVRDRRVGRWRQATAAKELSPVGASLRAARLRPSPRRLRLPPIARRPWLHCYP